jgi:hypothetical protein
MSERNDILNGVKAALANITTTNGFNYTVKDIFRKFIWHDNVYSWPTLLVLGGPQDLDDQLSPHRVSTLTAKVIGYTKDSKEPELAQCNLIEDVLNCLENVAYNPYQPKMTPKRVVTDEGMLTPLSDGVGMFEITLEFIYRGAR